MSDENIRPEIANMPVEQMERVILHSTETQKATIAEAHKLVEQVRANAARFGVTL